MSTPRSSIAVLLVLSLAPAAFAQTNNQWVTFTKDTNRLRNSDGSSASQIASDVEEKDYTAVDVNHDGWTDLIVMRKTPATTYGKRTNLLLMNENGMLVDRTAQYASDSDVAGDLGFLTPTNDRDVQCVDLDGDGWEDIITATTLSQSDLKHVSHPRVYRNKGSIGGVWQGFRFENARFPQLFLGSSPSAPDFCSVSAADANGDGFADLYFADYGAMKDKLLFNDGLGFFHDTGTSSMTAAMLDSSFGTASDIVDMNGDGHNDIVKCSGLGLNRVQVSYNDPNNLGHFINLQTTAGVGSTYHVDTGDINGDGRLDIAVSDDGSDFVRYNIGTDALGRVIWGAQRTYAFVSLQGDDGFAGNDYIVDLNNDGFGDTIHADFDVDVTNCGGRCHIYHNPGGTIGAEMTLKEEAELTGAGGWKGVVGMLASDLTGTFDVAVFDLDNDGDKDMVIGRCAGTQVWINQLVQPSSAVSYCFGDGTGTACPCGNNSAVGDDEGCMSSLGTGGRLRGTGQASIANDTFHLVGSRMTNSSVLYFQGNTQLVGGSGVVFGDGLRCATGSVRRLVTKTNANGSSTYPSGAEAPISVTGVVPSGATRNYQGWYRNAPNFCDPATFNLTNGVSVVWNP